MAVRPRRNAAAGSATTARVARKTFIRMTTIWETPWMRTSSSTRRAPMTSSANVTRSSSRGGRGSRHPSRRRLSIPAISATNGTQMMGIKGTSTMGIPPRPTRLNAIVAGRSPRANRTDRMNVSRATSRYPESDNPPNPSIKPTARARMGRMRAPHPSRGSAPAMSAAEIPTNDPIRMPVHGPLCEPPRRPTPTPIASPQPAPIRTSVCTPVTA